MFDDKKRSDKKLASTTLLGSFLLAASLSALPALATAEAMQDSMQKQGGDMHMEAKPAAGGAMAQGADMKMDKKMDKTMHKDDGMKMKSQSMDKDGSMKMKGNMSHQDH